ncbi:magnesium-translocating P-type ATPase [Ramlibacter ginsenosidimutans]|uniref:magnesium-translocating P-type ATPase n=1 Tax=Ramlibacter ginsenosidimutans TaxID=502333 RepID=UPI00191E5497|nr:magnesium-translocating P-type ATPase [Ramlibacter ginsenosidimutans]
MNALPAPSELPPEWWRLPAEALCSALRTSPQGLGEDDAHARLEAHGPNRLQGAAPRRLLVEIARRLGSPLVLVLIVAGAASLATGEGMSAWIIGSIVVLSIVIDRIQEQRAESAAARLASQVALTARVLRDGQERSVPVERIVPGDIVRLAAGAQVPADGVLLRASDLFVQQAALTGESFPVEKKPAAGAAASIEDAPWVVFMGSSVISGNAVMLACRTGPSAEIGQIAHLVAADRGELAMEHDLRRFGNFILRVAVFLVLFVVVVGGFLHRPWLETLLFALALAVGITPELLPMVVTVSLARGAQRLAREQVIVKRMAAIHNLGSMDVLCTDKTGTLTEARIALTRQVDVSGQDSAGVLENVFLNSHFESGLRTPLEDAVLAHGGVDVSAWRKLDEVPFDFERRRVSVLVEGPAGRRLSVKGAARDVLALCEQFEQEGRAQPWTPQVRAQAQATLQQLESGGLRVLGVAWKPVPDSVVNAGIADEAGLVFSGFAAFVDPPKADAAAALRDLHAKGVQVKVVTGDSELVARHVWEALGMPVKGILLGSEIATMDDRALAWRVQRANLFCRVDPVQKNRIIRALRARGHVVGYLGDGINDAPALHSADVGISVDTAADAARAAADLILLRPSLAVLSAAVSEGRRTFANTRKYILLGTSSSFGNMASMAAAAVLLPFLPMLPVQILLNNLLYDLVSTTLPLDRVEAREVARPQHWDMELVRRFMLVIGPVSSLFDLLTFWVLLQGLAATPAQFQSGWFIESLATQVLAVFVIRTHGPALGSRPHPALAWTALAVLAFAAVLPLTPLGAWFGLLVLPWGFYAAMAGMTVAYLVLLEAVKRRFHAHAQRRRATTAVLRRA